MKLLIIALGGLAASGASIIGSQSQVLGLLSSVPRRSAVVIVATAERRGTLSFATAERRGTLGDHGP
jgi:hypothetical protein